MAKYHILTDTASDIPKDLVKEYDIRILPMCVIHKTTSFLEGVNLDLPKLDSLIKETGELSKTAATSPQAFKEVFEAYPEDEIVIFTGIGSGFSASHNNAVEASKNMKNVYVIDSQTLSSGIAVFVLNIAKWVKEGKEIDEILTLASDLRERLMVFFALDTLEYMAKGGRCSSLQKFAATLLKIHPIIRVKDNRAGVGQKPRGKYEKAVEVMNQMFKDDLDNNNVDPAFAFVTTTLGYKDQEVMFNFAKPLAKSVNLLKGQAGCVVYSHCGPRTTGYCYAVNKVNKK